MSKSYFEHHIFCCVNRREPGNSRGSCADQGAETIRDYFKSRIKTLGISNSRVNQAGCLDRCELGPCIVIYPEGVWYRCATRQDVDEIISEHVEGGRVVERLRLP